MSFPSVGNLPISEKRRKKVVENLVNTFKQTAISRSIVEVSQATDEQENFGRLGLNLIVDKIWFVDLPQSETHYYYGNIGEMEGKEIALSEVKMIIDKILMELNEPRSIIKKPKELDEDSLQKALALLENRSYECESILVSVKDAGSFWLRDFEHFVGVKERATSLFGFEGYFTDIPIYWSNSLPENTTLLLNKKVGKLIVKEDLTASVTEIRESEVAGILKSLPVFDATKIREKIRLKAEEVIRFDFKNKDAAVVLKP